MITVNSFDTLMEGQNLKVFAINGNAPSVVTANDLNTLKETAHQQREGQTGLRAGDEVYFPPKELIEKCVLKNNFGTRPSYSIMCYVVRNGQSLKLPVGLSTFDRSCWPVINPWQIDDTTGAEKIDPLTGKPISTEVENCKQAGTPCYGNDDDPNPDYKADSEGIRQAFRNVVGTIYDCVMHLAGRHLVVKKVVEVPTLQPKQGATWNAAKRVFEIKVGTQTYSCAPGEPTKEVMRLGRQRFLDFGELDPLASKEVSPEK